MGKVKSELLEDGSNGVLRTSDYDVAWAAYSSAPSALARQLPNGDYLVFSPASAAMGHESGRHTPIKGG